MSEESESASSGDSRPASEHGEQEPAAQQSTGSGAGQGAPKSTTSGTGGTTGTSKTSTTSSAGGPTSTASSTGATTSTTAGAAPKAPYKPIKPKFGNIAQVGLDDYAAWTGGKPKADWSGLEDPDPAMINVAQYRPSSVGREAKSRYYRVQGMENKFT